MDDLSGLDWTASKPTLPTQKLPPMNPPSYYSSLRPTPPLSGRSTPSSLQNPPNGFKPPPNPNPNQSSRSNNSTPANDSFAKLVAFSSPPSTTNVGSIKNLSLLEQQKALRERREKDEGSQKKSINTSFGPQDGDFLDSLGNYTATHNRVTAPPSYAGTDEYGGQKLSTAINKPFASIGGGPQQHIDRIHGTGEIDLLSAFDSSSTVKVSDSSHRIISNVGDFQAIETNGGNNRKLAAASLSRSPSGTSEIYSADLDDDPFGLGSMGTKFAPQNKQTTTTADDDDILGALGRPVSEFAPSKEKELSPSDAVHTEEMGPAELAWARLIDMGFTPEKSREALERTESGVDVEAAVGWLLSQAHQDPSRNSRSRRPAANNDSGSENTRARANSSRNHSPIGGGLEPGWLQVQNRTDTTQRRRDSRSPVNGEKDSGKYAAEFGTTILKTANSLWKTGAKKLNQAVSEFNSDNESAHPKWMREAQVGGDNRRSRRPERQIGDSSNFEEQSVSQRSLRVKQSDVTDEALLLESGDGRPPRRPPRQQQVVPNTMSLNSSRDQSPAFSTKSREHELRQQRSMQSPQIRDRKVELRKEVEEQALNAYISPARRKKPAPKPPSPEPKLIFDALERDALPPQSPYKKPSVQPTSRVSQSPAPSRQLPSKRTTPQISSSVLRDCTKYRLEGTSAFKMGDYPRATAKYTTALLTLPPTHPLNIVLFTNRALAHLKTGDPKSSIADSESALAIIGSSRGANETIDLSGTEGSKDMRSFWAKAMTRQAEALEQLERWSEAAAVWKSCVEAGVGGATGIAGRNRCEKAAAGPPQNPRVSKPTAPKKPPNAAPKLSALELLSVDSSRPSSSADPHLQFAEAVTRLREANAAAERLDDEKFALADQVSERLARWRAGKEGNLRALLASLESVLWEGAGWKKVGMSELILAGKVKVVYMRGIGRVHPDKLPPAATTEQKMISAAVFATLNEAWDGFKRENGL